MQTTRLAVIRRACTCTLVTIALCGQAHAQPEPAPGPPATSEDSPERPPFSPSRRAEALFAEGAALFKQWRFDEAEQKFREALTHREHPLIHLYLSRALDKQLRLVEAHAVLMQALRQEHARLSPEDVQVAEDLQASLESRLSQIEVFCDEPGAEVSLDGEPWFTAPGQPRRMITAGQHVLIASKPGYFPITESVALIPGKQTRVVLRMTVDVVHVYRPWRLWQTWAVAGIGIAMSLTGGVLLLQAEKDYAAIQVELNTCTPNICEPVPPRRLESAEWKERIGAGALITGGTIVAAGLTVVLIKLGRTRRSKPSPGVEDLDILPMMSGDTAGISARLRF
jgi:hypothetical protein